MNKLSHIKKSGDPTMVDVSQKRDQLRTAIASGAITLQRETIQALRDNTTPKGNVLTTAQIAGITAAKKTSDLIPLCHPLMLNKVDVQTEMSNQGITVTTLARCDGKTGVEMEALTATSIALLTIYDMLKAIDKDMVISDIKLNSKTKEDVYAS